MEDAKLIALIDSIKGHSRPSQGGLGSVKGVPRRATSAAAAPVAPGASLLSRFFVKAGESAEPAYVRPSNSVVFKAPVDSDSDSGDGGTAVPAGKAPTTNSAKEPSKAERKAAKAARKAERAAIRAARAARREARRLHRDASDSVPPPAAPRLPTSAVEPVGKVTSSGKVKSEKKRPVESAPSDVPVEKRNKKSKKEAVAKESSEDDVKKSAPKKSKKSKKKKAAVSSDSDSSGSDSSSSSSDGDAPPSQPDSSYKSKKAKKSASKA